jgi:putative phosphoribosyl transferase
MRVENLKAGEISVTLPRSPFRLTADLTVPDGAVGLVIFAHGSGSSRQSPRNQAVAHNLQQLGIGTLLFDLLTEKEEQEDHYTGHLRFDIALLADRLAAVTEWVAAQDMARDLPFGYFGASTGAAAALMASVRAGERIKAVVSRGGRPDLAGESLLKVQAATLLIVGGNDAAVLSMNEQARKKLGCAHSLSVVSGASHLFEEPGALEEVGWLASEFFLKAFEGKVPEHQTVEKIAAAKTARPADRKLY